MYNFSERFNVVVVAGATQDSNRSAGVLWPGLMEQAIHQ
jgi:hypothetical protein